VATVLIPLPAEDFDPTEVAVSWKVLAGLGHAVAFATPDGTPSRTDELMATGRGLDPWGFVPGLDHVVGVGRALRADARGRSSLAEMVRSPEFLHPSSWEDIDIGAVDGLVLPGGHRARGMRAYLESTLLQARVGEAFDRRLPVGAICHGVLLAARSTDPASGRSVLHGRRTTALTWSLERKAWRVARVTRFWDRDYYRTYGEAPGEAPGYWSVQQEVTRALARPEDFCDVDPAGLYARMQSSGRTRDRVGDERPAWVVEDGNYVSARWPGDARTFARRFAALLDRTGDPPATART
jgi:putative intracellular protease/amidase